MKKVTVTSTSLRPGATHCDLYDGSEGNCIPWNTLAKFFQEESIGIEDKFWINRNS